MVDKHCAPSLDHLSPLSAGFRFAVCVLLLAVGLLGAPRAGESTGQASAQLRAQDAAEREFPNPFEVTARHRELADSARFAESEITALRNTEELEADFVGARQREREIRDAFDAVATAEYVRPDRFARLRDLAVLQDQRLGDLLERTFSRLERLDQLRSDWLEREQFWLIWRDRLMDHPQYSLVEPEIVQAIERIANVRNQIEDALPVILSFQRDVENVRASIRHTIEGVAAIREGRREALLRRDEALLFSTTFVNQLRPELWETWQPVVAIREAAFATFFRENAGLFALHVLIALAVIMAARRLRRRIYVEGTWASMLLYPKATGVFASTALLVQRYAFAPPIWDVLMWALLAGSIALLTVRLVPSRPLRLLVYFFAAFYPLFLAAEAIQMPVPLFRLALTSVSAAGVVLFAFLFRRESVEEKRTQPVRWTLGVAAVVWAVVFVVEVSGYYLLARWMLHATLISALVIFVVILLVAFARGAIRALLRLEAKGRLRFLRNVAIPLAERLVLIFQVILVVLAGLTLLDTWELVVSPVDAWRGIMGIGFEVAGIEITLGRILIAAIVVYLAFLASWLVRTFIQSELSPRWNVDPSVSNSIILLVHYMLIALGIMFGLGLIGVELQNFAIVAGALGIGIGFGLQNIVNNFVSGLILLFERPVRVGDTVVIDGDWGTIKKIGLRSTIVVTFDQSELIVPNADLVSEKVTNWTLTNPVARIIVPVGVAYGSDVSRVLEILNDSSHAHPAVLADPAPQVLFVGFGDSSLDFELRVWVGELRFRLMAMSTILMEIERRFNDAGIEIPFPQRDLHVRSMDPALRAALSAFGRPQDGGKTGDKEPEPDPAAGHTEAPGPEDSQP